MSNPIPKIKIVRAKVPDAQLIRKLENLVWGEEVVNKYDIPMFVRFGYVYVAKHDDKIVGAVVSYRTNKNEVYVCDIVVSQKYRRLRIAEKLFKKLLRSVKGKNVISFVNPQNIPTIKLHQKIGAKIIKRVKNVYRLNRGTKIDTRLFTRIKN